jgi:hypothetical protein
MRLKLFQDEIGKEQRSYEAERCQPADFFKV